MRPDDETRLEELLLDWEERRDGGDTDATEHTCARAGELAGELRRRIELLCSFDELLLSTDGSAVGAEPRTPNFDGFDVRGELGQGPMSVVYLAADRADDRLVAIKVFRPPSALVAPDERRRLARRFRREARVLAQLRHENIVRFLDRRLRGEHLYFIMEHMPGGSLRDRQREVMARSPVDIVAFMAQVARGVAYVHSEGVLHRDLKPGNILLDTDGRPRVSDFGLAKLLDEAFALDLSSVQSSRNALDGPAALTAIGPQPGTPAYMAPEQFHPHRGPVGRYTDVWALGVILYEFLTARRPFAGQTRLELERQVCNDAAAPLRQLRPDLDRRLERLVLRCLDKDTASRPTTEELTRALTAYRPGGSLTRLVAGLWYRVWPERSPSRGEPPARSGEDG